MNSATTKIDWNKDVEKHYVRRQVWLPAALAQVEASRDSGREPKYLTFCAAEAIDVFMFLQEGVLTRDPHTGIVVNTYFCEKEFEEFNRISQLLGAHHQGFLGDFEDMILFEDDDETRCLALSDTSRRYPRKLRKRLSLKESHHRFRGALPFDLINLDVCGTFFPPKGGIQSPMLRSIKTLLGWQTDHAEYDRRFESFTIFLTAHVEGGIENEDAIQELITMIENNSAYAGFSEALQDRFGTIDAAQIAGDCFPDFYCVALPKVIVGEAFERGWIADTRFSGRYRRIRETRAGDPASAYDMLVWVGRFDRHQPARQAFGRTQTPRDQDYAQLIRGLTRQPENVNDNASRASAEISDDLGSVVQSRDDFQAQVRDP